MPPGDVGKEFPAGMVIFRQGEAADCMYIVQSGKVATFLVEAGQESQTGVYEKGDSFGDMGVFMGRIRCESARSVGGARLITADYKFVLKKFRDDPSYAFQVIEKMALQNQARIERQERELKAQQARHAQQKAGNLDADYYDFAPVSAIDLDEEGIIRGINLTGATMLGAARRDLLGLPLAAFIPQDNLAAYQAHLVECGRSEEGVITQLSINTPKAAHSMVQIFSYLKQNSDRVVYRTLLTELASRQQEDGPSRALVETLSKKRRKSG